MHLCTNVFYTFTKANIKDEMKINLKVPMSKKNQFPRFHPASPRTSCPTRGHSRGSLGEVNTKVLVAQSCPTLCDPMDCSRPDSSVQGLLQAKILQWVAIPFSRGSSRPGNQSRVSCIISGFFTI